MNKRRRKTDVQLLKASMTAAQKKTLKRDNPFVSERNLMIQHFYRRGVMLPLLCQLTGMPRQTVYRIATQGFANGRRNNLTFSRRPERRDLRKFQELLKPLYNELKRLLKGA
jgi:hypothetical protein